MSVGDLADFHLLRPLWLIALLPAALVTWGAWRAMQAGHSDWARVVDPHLLPHLVAPSAGSMARWPVIALLAGWIAAILALAGPTWERVPGPAPGPERGEALVVVVSLSPSMGEADESPSRLGAARYKAADAVSRMNAGEAGLVAYADVPFVAVPLTVDLKSVTRLLPDLDAGAVRAMSARPDRAIAQAVDLMAGAGARHGRILLLADAPGEEPDLTRAAARAAAQAGYPVSVIGLGQGSASALAGLAEAGGGVFARLAADDSDLDAVLATAVTTSAPAMRSAEGDAWADAGVWLLLITVALAPLAFRRGWIAVLLIALLPCLAAPRSEAAEIDWPQDWAGLWARPDQQAAAAYARQDYDAAAALAQDQAMRGAALYRSGDYDGAAEAFARVPGADYNRGNALARGGRLEEAIGAYDAALAADPANADARENRRIVETEIELRKPPQPPTPPGGGGQSKDGGKGGNDENSRPPPDGNGDGSPPPPPSQSESGRPPAPPAPLPPRRPPELARNAPPDPPREPPASSSPQRQEPPAQPPAQPPQSAPSGETPATPQPAAPSPPAEAGGQTGGPQVRQSVASTPELPTSPTVSEDALRREQLLRMVEDDPGRLLSARIRSHYSGAPLRTYEGK